MTSRSDGLGPQKDPNSGRTRVESGPAGTHRPSHRAPAQRADPVDRLRWLRLSGEWHGDWANRKNGEESPAIHLLHADLAERSGR